MAPSGAAWWNTTASTRNANGWAFGLFTVPNNSGACVGENRVGPQKMCGPTSFVRTNNHYDASSTKLLWGR